MSSFGYQQVQTELQGVKKKPRENQFKTAEVEKMKEVDLAEKDQREETIQASKSFARKMIVSKCLACSLGLLQETISPSVQQRFKAGIKKQSGFGQ